MKLHEALDEVGKIYVPGVIAFYGKTPNDPWQEAHDRLEQEYFSSVEPKAKEKAAKAFVARCRSMVEHFKKHGDPAKSLSYADAFAIGNDTLVAELTSCFEHVCYVCREKEGIRIEMSDTGKTRVACQEHATPKPKGRK